MKTELGLVLTAWVRYCVCALGWHLCNMSAAISVGPAGQQVATTDLVVLRRVVEAGEEVAVPQSSGFMIALFVP